MFCGLPPLKYGFIADRQCTRLALRDRRGERAQSGITTDLERSNRLPRPLRLPPA
jgi:hypothetical protein